MSNQTNLKEKKGFMSLRNNVFATKLMLWKRISPLEHFLVEIIIEKTIGWRQKECLIPIETFVETTDTKRTHVYAALRSLKEKGIIVVTKTKQGSIYGLDENYFGGLLTKKHEEAYQARRNKIKIVVDKSKTSDENPSHQVTEIRHSECYKSVTPSDGNPSQEIAHDNEIIKESSVLKTFFKDNIKDILKDRGKNGESFTPLGNGNGIGYRPSARTPEEGQIEKLRQIRLLAQTETG